MPGPLLRGKAAMAVVFVVVLLLPQILRFLPQSDYLMDVAITTAIYVTLALGLNVTVGLAGLLDLGYIAFYGLGAYAAAIVIHGGAAQATVAGGPGFWVALPVALALAAIAGLLIGLPTLRLRGDYLAIVTLAFGQIAKLSENNWDWLTNGPQGMEVAKPILLGAELRSPYVLYYIIAIIGIVTWACVRNLNNSAVGRAWVAIREDEIAAGAMGINVPKMKLLAFMTGAAFAGLAGAFFASKSGFISPPSFDFIETIIILAMVVLGGMGSLPGVILGGIILAILPEFLRSLPSILQMEGSFDITPYRMLIYGGAMVLIMFWRPEGLLPEAHRRRELHPTLAEGERESVGHV
jgi:branched-chain amino acid transport system permease protein